MKVGSLLGEWAASAYGAVKNKLKSNKELHRRVKLLKRSYYARKNAYPDWRAILKGQGPPVPLAPSDGKRPRILLGTSVGALHSMVTVESLLGAALTLRGAEVHVFLCDGVLPACMDCDTHWFPDAKDLVEKGPQGSLCGTCRKFGSKPFRDCGIRIHAYGDYLSAKDRAECARIARETPRADIDRTTWEGMAVGEHSLAGALRFFARATLDGEPRGEAVLRRYFEAGLLTARATRKLLQTLDFDCAVFNHGIYIPQGIIGEAARRAGIRVVNWNPAYRKQCFIFSHGDTYHHTLMDEPTEKWENVVLSATKETELGNYLKSRWSGTQDWIWFHEKPQFDLDSIARETGVDFSKPCIGMLTNVMWDAQLHYPANAFENMLTWAVETIAYFAKRPELQLLIRVHPAEVRANLKSRQPIAEEIRRRFPVLPPNVFIIGPESQVSTYAAMSECDSVIIYGTKTGVELTSMGIPVVVAGEAWIRNKGITQDASSRDDYFRILDGLPLGKRLDEASVRRANLYAFHFFFRRMIPVKLVRPEGKGWVSFTLPPDLGLEDLAPGRDAGLDVICDGILKATDFIFPAETHNEG